MKRQFTDNNLVYNMNLHERRFLFAEDFPPHIRELYIPKPIGSSSTHQGQSSNQQDPGPSSSGRRRQREGGNGSRGSSSRTRGRHNGGGNGEE
ncbi:hypothetical protein Mgra_00009642 [Meloidogyne graminicola]|uniref:Uncharacterized protein n=1 Tax=Meloidogyne graminicola TaxID=189291 RepID=A0A8S9ZBD5_9BILA|nr:hypothetical protein Mgra_00009642 [Meloidogyne graminicola]